MDQKTYTGITRADVDKIRSGLGNYGITVPDGDDVDVQGPLGVKMRVKYDEPNEALTLAIIEKPGYITEGQIWKVVEMGAGKAGRGS